MTDCYDSYDDTKRKMFEVQCNKVINTFTKIKEIPIEKIFTPRDRFIYYYHDIEFIIKQFTYDYDLDIEFILDIHNETHEFLFCVESLSKLLDIKNIHNLIQNYSNNEKKYIDPYFDPDYDEEYNYKHYLTIDGFIRLLREYDNTKIACLIKYLGITHLHIQNADFVAGYECKVGQNCAF